MTNRILRNHLRIAIWQSLVDLFMCSWDFDTHCQRCQFRERNFKGGLIQKRPCYNHLNLCKSLLRVWFLSWQAQGMISSANDCSELWRFQIFNFNVLGKSRELHLHSRSSSREKCWDKMCVWLVAVAQSAERRGTGLACDRSGLRTTHCNTPVGVVLSCFATLELPQWNGCTKEKRFFWSSTSISEGYLARKLCCKRRK